MAFGWLTERPGEKASCQRKPLHGNTGRLTVPVPGQLSDTIILIRSGTKESIGESLRMS